MLTLQRNAPFSYFLIVCLSQGEVSFLGLLLLYGYSKRFIPSLIKHLIIVTIIVLILLETYLQYIQNAPFEQRF